MEIKTEQDLRDYVTYIVDEMLTIPEYPCLVFVRLEKFADTLRFYSGYRADGSIETDKTIAKSNVRKELMGYFCVDDFDEVFNELVGSKLTFEKKIVID